MADEEYTGTNKTPKISKSRLEIIVEAVSMTLLLVTPFFVLIVVLTQNNSALQERLQIIRNLSIDAGVSQTKVSSTAVCYDDGCLDAATDILKNMNGLVNPCQDFYQFSCGRHLDGDAALSAMEKLTVRVANVTVGILMGKEEENEPVPLKQARKLFLQCVAGMDELQSLKDVIRDFGGWQLLNRFLRIRDKYFDWMGALAKLFRKTGRFAVFAVYSLPHPKNSDKKVIYIDQPFGSDAFGMPREILINREKNRELFSAYETYIFRVTRELNDIAGDVELKKSAKEIVNFEEKLAKFSSSDEQRHDKNRLYNPYTLKDYQKETDSVDEGRFKINWTNLLKKFFEPTGITDISENETVIVQEKGYVESVIRLLAEEEMKGSNAMTDYIMWRLLETTARLTTKSMRDITFEFEKQVKGLPMQHPRVVSCLEYFIRGESGFGMAFAGKYLERELERNAKVDVSKMVGNLKDAFEEMVKESIWMREETKVRAIEKKNAMASMIAYPEKIKNRLLVEEEYKGLQLGKNYLESRLAVREFLTDKSFGELRKPTNKTEWALPPFTVNAWHIQFYNVIVAAGILHPPYFASDRPQHQNYGGLGTIILHEILHGFDNQGAQYDKKGNLKNWMDEISKMKYEVRGECLAAQYSKYCYDFGYGDRRCINGNFTLGENIADNGGLRHSFRAYKNYIKKNGPELRLPGLEKYSPEQLYFIGYANIWCQAIPEDMLKNILITDPHSPPEWRVNGAVKNSQEFADAFNCPVDLKGMNPPRQEKCIIW